MTDEVCLKKEQEEDRVCSCCCWRPIHKLHHQRIVGELSESQRSHWRAIGESLESLSRVLGESPRRESSESVVRESRQKELSESHWGELSESVVGESRRKESLERFIGESWWRESSMRVTALVRSERLIWHRLVWDKLVAQRFVQRESFLEWLVRRETRLERVGESRCLFVNCPMHFPFVSFFLNVILSRLPWSIWAMPSCLSSPVPTFFLLHISTHARPNWWKYWNIEFQMDLSPAI